MQSNKLGYRLCSGAKGLALMLPLWATLLAGQLSAGTILYDVTFQGGNVYRYEFFPKNVVLLANQEIDIRFDPILFGNLFNGVAGANFKLSLLQPNNPPGALGDYSALALIDNPGLAGPFSVDVTWLSSGSPGSLPYLIHQFDITGQRIIGTLEVGTLGAPEAGGRLLSLVGIAMIGVLRFAWRRSF
jgi:hypothetical protein